MNSLSRVPAEPRRQVLRVALGLASESPGNTAVRRSLVQQDHPVEQLVAQPRTG